MKAYFQMNKKGFTLIELVMIIVLVGIILPGIMLYFIQGVRDSSYSQRRTTAIFLADALMEEIKSKRWDESMSINVTCGNASLSLVAEELTRDLYDDIDDFNAVVNVTPPQNSQGIPMANYPGFAQQVTVAYVNPADLNTAVGGPTCYKRIEVRIVDTGSNETIRLVSLMTGY